MEINKLYRDINKILAEWNPIGVDDNIVAGEYIGYIPAIIKSLTNDESPVKCLEDILINKIGLQYDPNNAEHVGDLRSISNKILQVYSEHKT